MDVRQQNPISGVAANAVARAMRARVRARRALARLQVVHGQRRRRSFQCPECDKAYSVGRALSGHISLHSNISKGRSFRCKECSQTFPTVHALGGHSRRHSSQRRRMMRMNPQPDNGGTDHPPRTRAGGDVMVVPVENGDVISESHPPKLIDFMSILDSKLHVDGEAAKIAENNVNAEADESVELDLELRL